MINPARGEVRRVDLGASATVRPCLVVSVPLEVGDRALVVLVPVHPDACGEHLGGSRTAPTRFGSFPRMWGT